MICNHLQLYRQIERIINYCLHHHHDRWLKYNDNININIMTCTGFPYLTTNTERQIVKIVIYHFYAKSVLKDYYHLNKRIDHFFIRSKNWVIILIKSKKERIFFRILEDLDQSRISNLLRMMLEKYLINIFESAS